MEARERVDVTSTSVMLADLPIGVAHDAADALRAWTRNEPVGIDELIQLLVRTRSVLLAEASPDHWILMFDPSGTGQTDGVGELSVSLAEQRAAQAARVSRVIATVKDALLNQHT